MKKFKVYRDNQMYANSFHKENSPSDISIIRYLNMIEHAMDLNSIKSH